MTDTPLPYHHAQVLRSLPGWSRQLHPRHVRQILQRTRMEHMDEEGHEAAWLETASAHQRLLLEQAQRRRTESQTAWRKAVAGWQGISAFCEPLLQERLKLDIPVTQARFCSQPFDIDNYLAESQGHYDFEPEPTGPLSSRSLLEAALHNLAPVPDSAPLASLHSDDTLFPASATTAPFAANPAAGEGLPGLSVEQFIVACRTLNLGRRYQQHLDSVFSAEGMQAKWVQARCDELTVQAVIAWIRGTLTELGYQAVRMLCVGLAQPRYGSAEVAVQRLTLLGIPINDVLVLSPRAASEPECIAYLPFDDAPVHEFANFKAMGLYLRSRLREPDYLARLLEHCAHQDRAQLARKLRARLNDSVIEDEDFWLDYPYAPVSQSLGSQPARFPALPASLVEIRQPLWPALYAGFVQRARQRAREIAVPTEDFDAAWRDAKLKHWAEEGLSVLNVAAMFVPGLDVLMLPVFAWQIMDSTYAGLKAWSEGETALGASFAEWVLSNAGVAFAVGGGAAATRQLAQQVEHFAEGLERISAENGERLWKPDLSAYRSDITLPRLATPDSQGLYRHDGRLLVQFDQDYLEVTRLDHDNLLVHAPEPADDYQPVLRGNGAGAWRLPHDNPLTWSDAQLLQRLGPIASHFSADELLTVQQLTATSSDALRHAHFNHLPAPALLVDALQRLRLDSEIGEMIDALESGKPLAAHRHHAAAALTQLAGWPTDLQVKVFKGPEPWGEAMLYGTTDQPRNWAVEITRTQLEDGELAEAALQQLSEDEVSTLLGELAPDQQPRHVLQLRLAEHLRRQRGALFSDQYARLQQALGTPAQRLSVEFSDLPARALEEIVAAASADEQASMRGTTAALPLRVMQEARLMQARLRLDRALLGIYRPALGNTDSELLIAGVRAALPELMAFEAHWQALLDDRPMAARLLGLQPPKPGYRSPLRRSEGRLGYEVEELDCTRTRRSGGRTCLPWPRSPERRLRDLYPTLDRQERRAMLDEMRANTEQRGSVAGQIQELKAELTRFSHELTEWCFAATGHERIDREAFREALIGAWRREGGQLLLLQRFQLTTWPPLSVQFPHITDLETRGLNIQHVSPRFLHSFPALKRLTLKLNPAIDTESLFTALREYPHLHTLELQSCNLQQLPAIAEQVLSGMGRLRTLNLSHNQLQLSQSQWATLARLPLQELNLNNNHISLDASHAAYFRSMTRLQQLNLGSNPLGLAPDLGNMDNLIVLQMSHAQLIEWPAGLTRLMLAPRYRLRRVNLAFNQLHSIPDVQTVIDSPFALGVRSQRLYAGLHLIGNAFDEATARALRTRDLIEREVPVIDRIHPIAHHNEWHNLLGRRPVNWLDSADETQQALWHALFDNHANRYLKDVIERTGASAEARSNPQGLATQIWALLEQAHGDTDLREHLEEMAQAFPATCGDAGTDAFSTLEIEALAHRSSTDATVAAPYLFNFYRRLYRRDLVNHLAARIHAARLERQTALLHGGDLGPLDPLDDISDAQLRQGGLDDIEIRLALRQDLAARLQFPEPSAQMLYRQAAKVSTQTVAKVEAAVRALDAQEAERRAWVGNQPGWQHFLQQRFTPRFKALDEQWYAGTEYLDYCRDDSNEAVTSLTDEVLSTLQQSLPADKTPQRVDGVLQRIDLSGDDDADNYTIASAEVAAGRQRAWESLIGSLTAEQDTYDGATDL